MSEFHYSLGLDIGIGSVGWAVLRNDITGEPEKIQDLGVRVFDKPEHPKTGASLAAPRREARSARRRTRRRRHRLERIRYLLETQGVMTREEIAELYADRHTPVSPYQLRAEGLDRLLEREELVRVLIQLAQRRGYRSSSKAEEAGDKEAGAVKDAVRENRLCMEKNGYRTLGEMIWKDERFWEQHPDGTAYHHTRNRAGDYSFTFDRASVVREVRAIFSAQRDHGSPWATQELETAYLSILESQRNFDEGPGGDSPFRGGIEAKVGICTLEREAQEPRAAKAAYTFEYFKLLQDLNHLRLARTGFPSVPLDQEQRDSLKNAALQSPSLTYAQLRKKLGLDEEVYFNNLFYGRKTREEAEKAKWPQMQSYHKMRKAIDGALGKGAFQALTPDQLDAIGTILTCYKSDDRRKETLREAGIDEKYDEALLSLSFRQFGKLSLAAMKKLIPLLEEGQRYDEACAAVYGDHRGEGKQERKSKLSLDDMDEIPNPVVRRAVSQTIKVINAVVRTYGPPDVVRIELAREMGKPFEERNKIQKGQEDNRKRNERAKEQAAEYKGDRVTGLDIVKFKLFQEQDGICPYSGRNLDLSRLFEAGYADVDHIIPYSRCFDDSYKNKVLVLASENRNKGNRTPFEYFGQDEARWHSFQVLVERIYGKDFRKRQRLLKRSFTPEEEAGFIQRNLEDTQYITRSVHRLLREHLSFAESRYSKRPVQAVNGAVTAMLRSRWGIRKIREDGDLHHCLDAVVIAVTSPGMIQRLTSYNKQRECAFTPGAGYVDPDTGEVLTKERYDEKYAPQFPQPWDWFRKELEARLEPDPRAVIDHLGLANYDSDEEIPPVFVSRMPNHKVTGPAHAETIRSGVDPSGTVSKKALTELKLNKEGEIEGYYNPASDTLLYEALKARLRQFDGDGAKAFAEPFHKPKRDGSPGPVVNKVKIFEKSTLNLPVNGGVAANGDMLRIDVFRVEGDGYYFVPVYVADTKEEALPNKAVIAHKPYEEWKEMKPEDFLFSLYPGDLIRVRSRRGVKLNLAKDGTGEKTITREDGLYYYRGADISTGAVQIETHDRRYSARGVGMKTLLSIEKYQVDILGSYHRVSLPEKRMGFGKGR